MSPCSSFCFSLSVRPQVINMSAVMDRLPYKYLLTFYCFTAVCVYGRGQDTLPPCETELRVQRGTTWEVAPRQRLRVKCPVKHCGDSVIVAWCKFLDDHCEPIDSTENVGIKQQDNPAVNELDSFLIFKRISIHDDGLYRCYLKGFQHEIISHTINISVSDSYERIKQSGTHNSKAEKLSDVPSDDDDDDVSWLPYLTICAGVALVVIILTMLTVLIDRCQTRVPTLHHTKGQEMSNRVIPDLPKWSNPPPTVLQNYSSFPNEIHSASVPKLPPSPPPRPTRKNQSPVGNTAGEHQSSDYSVYAIINH